MIGSGKLDHKVYEQNVAFWDRAWGGVKKPHTQMPKLPYIDTLPEKLRQANARKILDLGCGSGWLSIYLAREGFQVSGVDVAAHAIELAKMWADQENLVANFTTADITELPYEAEYFDAVVANSVFEHLTYELAIDSLKQLKKVMRPGALFFGCFDKVGGGPGEYYELEDGTHVYTDKHLSGMLLRYFNDDELRQLFEGWEILSLETIESGSRILWARR